MIRKIMLILFCSIILFPAFISAEAHDFKVGEKVRINTGSWILVKAINKNDNNQNIGYKGLDHSIDYDGAYIKFSQYYIDTEFQPIKYRDNVKVICIGPYAFEPLEIKPQFIRLKYLGTCFEVLPDPEDKVLKVENKVENKTSFIRK